MKKLKKNSLITHIAISAMGFGLGGIFFGWRHYESLSSELFVDPIPYLSAVIIWGFLGGVALSIFSKNIKQIFRTGLFGIIGWLVGGLAGHIMFYSTFIFWPLIFPETLEKFGAFWGLVGAILATGAFIGGFYARALRIKIWPMVLWGVIGFTLGTILGLTIDNVLMKSWVLVGILTWFLMTGVTLGIFLGLGVYRGTLKPSSKK